jgi:hypothetical protein
MLITRIEGDTPLLQGFQSQLHLLFIVAMDFWCYLDMHHCAISPANMREVFAVFGIDQFGSIDLLETIGNKQMVSYRWTYGISLQDFISRRMLYVDDSILVLEGHS